MTDILKTLSDFNYTDGVDDVMAVYVNRLLAASLRAEYRNVETLTADKTLIDADTPLQVLTASGASRDVTLPAVSIDNHPFMVVNAGATYSLVLKDAGATTIATVAPGGAQLILPSGAGWYTAAQTQAQDGWVAGTGTWSYSSADSPTFVISIDNDQTGIIGVGMRIKLTQTTPKYFIVTAVGAYSGGVTLITVYGGTDYTLANAAITSPFWSNVKAPLGFPMSPDKWTVSLLDTSDRSQATPTAATWYNVGSLSISLPIGVWRVTYSSAMAAVSTASQTLLAVYSTLSTANNSESDKRFSGAANTGGASGTLYCIAMLTKQKVLTLAAKTTYYILLMTTTTCASITLYGSSVATTEVTAVCAYL